MNIIYMHTHDTGRYIQPYGYNIPTPNLMSLAEKGTLFRNAHCAGPTCSPSRAAMLSGMSCHSSGMLGLVNRGFQMSDYSKHLVSFLNQKGFETVLSGIQHEATDSKKIGYQKDIMRGKEIFTDFKTDDLNRAKAAAEYIKEQHEVPYFLSVGLVNTHRKVDGFQDEKNVNANYVMPPFTVPDKKETREDMAAFISSAMIVDRCVGIVMDALKVSGKEDETIFIFTTDHGIAFPKMKCYLYDTGTGVSLIIKYPGSKYNGSAIDALVSHIDLFPTLCDMLNLEKPEWLEGKSMLPLLMGECESINEEIFSEVTFHAGYEPMRCIRTERYKLIRFYDEHSQLVFSNIDDSPTKKFLLENGYRGETREKEMLFDLYYDPLERVNCINNPRYKEVDKKLAERLEAWMENTNDPLLAGKVEKPKEAFINTLDCLSPRTKDYV